MCLTSNRLNKILFTNILSDKCVCSVNIVVKGDRQRKRVISDVALLTGVSDCTVSFSGCYRREVGTRLLIREYIHFIMLATKANSECNKSTGNCVIRTTHVCNFML